MQNIGVIFFVPDLEPTSDVGLLLTGDSSAVSLCEVFVEYVAGRLKTFKNRRLLISICLQLSLRWRERSEVMWVD